jgi:hypothetical protein
MVQRERRNMTTDPDPSPGNQEPCDAPDRVLPAEEVFIENADPVATANVAPAADVVRRPPGPGFWESIAWMIGPLVTQVVGLLIAAALLLVWSLVSSGAAGDAGGPGPIDGATLVRAFTALFREEFIVVIGITQLVIAVYALLAVHLRLRPGGLKRLGWKLPRMGHFLLIVAGMLPLAALSTQLQNEIFRLFPWSHESIAELIESMTAAPLWAGVLIIGAGPAVGEELLFRGLIGRGLVARYGVVFGIAVTSVLFGVMHLNPAQSIGTIPLGIAMHFVYLTTRSFWAPMTLHFLNNAFSVAMAKFGEASDVKELAADYSESLPGSLLLTSACLLAAIGLVLWQTRVRYVNRAGDVWDPGYPTAEAPPPEAGARPVSQSPAPGLIFGTALCGLVFVAAVWMMAVGG